MLAPQVVAIAAGPLYPTPRALSRPAAARETKLDAALAEMERSAARVVDLLARERADALLAC